MNALEVSNMIRRSPVLAKIYRANAILVDGFGLSTSINFDIVKYDSVLEELYNSGKHDVTKIIKNVILTLTVVDDDFNEFDFEYSLKDIIESKVMDDGSVETPDEIDNDTGDVIEHGEVLKFYKLI